MTRDHVKQAESHACGLLIHSTDNRALRACVASVVRAWRKVGDHERARWFIRHAYYVGSPAMLKDGELA